MHYRKTWCWVSVWRKSAGGTLLCSWCGIISGEVFVWILGHWWNNNILDETKFWLWGIVKIHSMYSTSTLAKSRVIVKNSHADSHILTRFPGLFHLYSDLSFLNCWSVLNSCCLLFRLGWSSVIYRKLWS